MIMSMRGKRVPKVIVICNVQFYELNLFDVDI